MPTVVECPSCGKKLKVPDEYIGKKVRCSDCNGTFVSEKPPSKAPPKAPVRAEPDDVADDDDEAPVRKRSRDSVEPHRGVLVLILGIASVAMPFIGFAVIGFVPGILAWIFGKNDLKKMDEGTMDSEGRSNTNLGKILGLVGMIINGGALLVGCAIVILWLVLGVALFSAASKSMPPSPAVSTNAPLSQGGKSTNESSAKKADEIKAGSVDTADLLKNPSKYKGQTITLTLLVDEPIKNKGSLKDYVGKDVKFAALTKNRQRLEIKITIPDGLEVPKAGYGDVVKVTFVCKDGSLQKGNEAKSIETASLP